MDKNTRIYKGIEESNNLIVDSEERGIIAYYLKSKKEIMKVQLGLFWTFFEEISCLF
jgi:hypothetical protein